MSAIADLPLNMRAKVSVAGECWEWVAARNSRGYGCVGIAGRTLLAHRKSYELLVGPIPVGLTIDHLCRNIVCINPAHLEPVTREENNRREAAAITHCVRGHAFTAANTYVCKSRANRECRTCRNERPQSPADAAPAVSAGFSSSPDAA